MPFELYEAPQIYQRLLYNALYGFLAISSTFGHGGQEELFTTGFPETIHEPSVLGRRSYIDDILVTSESWDDSFGKVKRLLDVCDK